MALDLGTEPIFESTSESGGDEPAGPPAERAAARRPADEADVGTESGGEEMTATQAAEGALKRRKWTGTEEVQRKWLISTAKDIELDRCAWDLQLCHGQTRALDEGHVARLKASLEERPPTAPVRVCLWENSADRKFYFLSGQHIGRAVKKIREDRETQGLGLQRWHTHVCADVLKFETPLWQRQLMAGASNASTRLHRSTTIAECLRQVVKLEADPELAVHDRILRAVVQCGLNVTGTSPVCTLSSELRARSSDCIARVASTSGIRGNLHCATVCIYYARVVVAFLVATTTRA
jgi:hypothetical protein